MADSWEGYRSWIRQNPKKTAAYATAGIAIAAPMAIAGPVLGAFGFGASGIAAGSIAAGAQTANVAAGSLFAILQSAAMGGYGVATVGGVVQAGGILGGIYTTLKKASDRRSLNPVENAWGPFSGHDDADNNNLNSKPMSRHDDIVKATNRLWDSFPIEDLITMMSKTPEIVKRLKEMKDSLLRY
ncbi:hypothetical protein F4813DRAFT_354080 [Daldinia decipiens]|uniref:uncharacterized protein n=1 Tax=Daldinia decipiens TaxID=326647 RepID=UPI0020C2E1C2|nr:uncharacterized protein F4813DRAFT_354080 [Daldinia decipiens]KAI1659172.1 hypothetical protein F4813DRAFT_354080 [Daldinia decipiens]